ncbi:MAG: hypothetical protein AAFV46_00175 [Cyanobacteria bacterium J06635_11]
MTAFAPIELTAASVALDADLAKRADDAKAEDYLNKQATQAADVLFTESVFGEKVKGMLPQMADRVAAAATKSQFEAYRARGVEFTADEARAAFRDRKTKTQALLANKLASISENTPHKEAYAARILAARPELTTLTETQKEQLDSGSGFQLSPAQAAGYLIRQGKLDKDSLASVGRFMYRAQAGAADEDYAALDDRTRNLIANEAEEKRYSAEPGEGWGVTTPVMAPLMGTMGAITGAVGGALGAVSGDPEAGVMAPIEGAVEGFKAGVAGERTSKFALGNVLRRERTAEVEQVKQQVADEIIAERKRGDTWLKTADQGEVLRELEYRVDQRIGEGVRFFYDHPETVELAVDVATPVGGLFRAAGKGAQAVARGVQAADDAVAGGRGAQALRAVDDSRLVRKVREGLSNQPYAYQAGKRADEVRGIGLENIATQERAREFTQAMDEAIKPIRDIAAKTQSSRDEVADVLRQVKRGEEGAELKLTTILERSGEFTAAQRKTYGQVIDKVKKIQDDAGAEAQRLLRDSPELVDEFAKSMVTNPTKAKALGEAAQLQAYARGEGHLHALMGGELSSPAVAAAKVKHLEKTKGMDFVVTRDKEMLRLIDPDYTKLAGEGIEVAGVVPRYLDNALRHLRDIRVAIPPQLPGPAQLASEVFKSINATFSAAVVTARPDRLINELPANAAMMGTFLGTRSLGRNLNDVAYYMGRELDRIAPIGPGVGKLLQKTARGPEITARNGAKLNADQLYDVAREFGFVSDVGRFDPSDLLNMTTSTGAKVRDAVQAAGRGLSLGTDYAVAAQDSAFRISTFAEFLRRAPDLSRNSIRAAAAKAARSSVHLKNLAPANRALATYIPFWSFTSHTGTMAAEILRRHPDRVAKWIEGTNTYAQKQGAEPVFTNQSLDWARHSSVGMGGGIADRFMFLPQDALFAIPDTVDSYFKSNPRDALRRQFGPAGELAVTMITGVTRDGIELPPELYWNELGESLVRDLTPHLITTYKGAGDYRQMVTEFGDEGVQMFGSDAMRLQIAYQRRSRGLAGLFDDSFQPIPGYEGMLGGLRNLVAQPYANDVNANLRREQFQNLNSIENIANYTRRRN